MKIHLFRHGQTDWNKERRVQGQRESSLTDEGRQQAKRLRDEIATSGISRVYCSSSVRTRETTALLFAGMDVEIEYSDALREIFLGPWEGSLYADMEQKFPESFANFWQRPHAFILEGAESFLDTQQRGVAEFERILKTDASSDVAIVSHGVLIKTILCHVENRPLARLWEPPEMHNCSHSIIEVKETPRILRYAGVDYTEAVNAVN